MKEDFHLPVTLLPWFLKKASLLPFRNLSLLLLLFGIVARTLAAERVTGAQFEQILLTIKDMPDQSAARRIYALVLTERLSPARLSRCERIVAGEDAKEALLAVADMSLFLDPPAADLPDIPTPDAATQRQMLARTVGEVNKAEHLLPNLYATRVTNTYKKELPQNNPQHLVGKSTAVILYRDGEEVTHSKGAHGQAGGLITSGEFGPIRGTALVDAAQGNLTWNRWELGPTGPEAVFRYAVTADKSHFEVNRRFSDYRGEITIDPESGAILRIALKAEDPFGSVSDIVVEYGPVELGGRTYICPLRGIALSVSFALQWLNDVAFEQYHLYRGGARILPGVDTVVRAKKSP